MALTTETGQTAHIGHGRRAVASATCKKQSRRASGALVNWVTRRPLRHRIRVTVDPLIVSSLFQVKDTRRVS